VTAAAGDPYGRADVGGTRLPAAGVPMVDRLPGASAALAATRGIAVSFRRVRRGSPRVRCPTPYGTE